MKSINFTEKELDFLREQYQDELESTLEYVEQIYEILKKLGPPSAVSFIETSETEPKEVKRRGRKPKVKVPVLKEPKKRGPKPRVKTAEPKVPKKRGRPFKVAAVPAVEPSPVAEAKQPKKKGRKPATAAVAKSEPPKAPVKVAKEVKKIVPKKSTSRRKRRWRGITLAPMSKPIKLKEPVEEYFEEPVPEGKSNVAPVIEPMTTPVGEPKE
jgi:hypothetical protein